MKTVLITAAVLINACAFAQPTSAPAPEPTPEQVAAATELLTAVNASAKPAEISPEMEPYIPAIKESANLLTEISTILKGVKDKASADAAAPKISEAFAKMKALDEAYKNLPEPTPELRAKLQPVIMQHMAQPVQEFKLRLITIAAAQAYGSEALMQAFDPPGNPE